MNIYSPEFKVNFIVNVNFMCREQDDLPVVLKRKANCADIITVIVSGLCKMNLKE